MCLVKDLGEKPFVGEAIFKLLPIKINCQPLESQGFLGLDFFFLTKPCVRNVLPLWAEALLSAWALSWCESRSSACTFTSSFINSDQTKTPSLMTKLLFTSIVTEIFATISSKLSFNVEVLELQNPSGERLILMPVQHLAGACGRYP